MSIRGRGLIVNRNRTRKVIQDAERQKSSENGRRWPKTDRRAGAGNNRPSFGTLHTGGGRRVRNRIPDA